MKRYMLHVSMTRIDKCLSRVYARELPVASFINDREATDTDILNHLQLYSQVFKNLTSDANVDTPCRPRVIIFRCHEPLCGGLGDRLRGIIFTFYWSLLLGAQFYIRMDFPVDLQEYFDINPLFVLPPASKNSEYQVLNFVDNCDVKNFVYENFDVAWKDMDHVEIRTNCFQWTNFKENPYMLDRINHFFPYLKEMTSIQMSSTALRLLIKGPSSYSLDRINLLSDVATSASEVLLQIGIQHRHGDLDFGRPDTHRFSVDSAVCFANKAIEVCKAHANKFCVFVITSDTTAASLRIRQVIQSSDLHDSNFTMIETNGAITHIDASDSWELNGMSSRDYFAKTFIDWLLLVRSDYLIISRSGYGETASWYSMPPTERFLELEKIDDKGCPLVQDYMYHMSK